MSTTDAADPTNHEPTQQSAEFIDLPENVPGDDRTPRTDTHGSDKSDDQ
jgi:hypothetical protein